MQVLLVVGHAVLVFASRSIHEFSDFPFSCRIVRPLAEGASTEKRRPEVLQAPTDA
jgi:hypothetical protein